jgi:hypothetical protein
MSKALMATIVVATWVVAGTGSALAHHDGSLGVFPPDSSPYGMTYPEWQGAYQIWLNEIPAPVNPLFEPSSRRNCELQPGGDVVFLGGTGADCTIPAGAAVAFSPALGFFECSTAEGVGETWGELRTCAREHFAAEINPDLYHQKVLIDGERLVHQRQWVAHTPGEIIDFPRNNIWGAEPGPSRSITKGFLFIVEPLDPGNHRIVVIARDEVVGNFRWVWRLRVVDD